jgi:hypothetical protein
MPFDFLGTFNKSQFERLAAYARDQLIYVDARILHLTIEQNRVGFLKFTYDSAGKPTNYSTGGSGASPTYIGKLMAAYEALGGDPFYDLQTRASSDQPIFFQKGDEAVSAKIMSNGEPIPQLGLADAPSGNLVRQIKSWINPSLDRRAAIERKVRRMIDYRDQLQTEIDELKVIKAAAETEGSLENLISEVNLLLADPSYRATGNDKGGDPFGKLTLAPYASYEPGEDRAGPDGVAVERTEDGYTISGGGGTTA